MGTLNKRSLPKYWRVFYTKARSEMKCETRLEEKGLDVFLPKMEEVHQWSDRKKKVTVPLFRSYIFANVDERDRLSVLQTDGITRCLTFGGRLVAMREQEIEQLKILQQSRDMLSIARYGRRPGIGEEVVITDGPLEGLTGIVEDHRGQLDVVVSIDTIRQAVRVRVHTGNVRRTKSSITSVAS